MTTPDNNKMIFKEPRQDICRFCVVINVVNVFPALFFKRREETDDEKYCLSFKLVEAARSC